MSIRPTFAPQACWVSVILFFLFPVPAYAYIDPGTGSMLFSFFIGVAATLFFSLKTAYYKMGFLFSWFREKHPEVKIPIVLYSEGKKYYNTFGPILEEFENRKQSVLYYTSSDDDPAFSQGFEYVKSEFIGQGNRAYIRLAFLAADVCLMTTPGLDVFQLKRSQRVKHYSHIFHGIGDACGYRLFGLDYYDSVLLTCNVNGTYVRELERKRSLKPKELVVVGSTDLDRLAEGVLEFEMEPRTVFSVLVAPSWGPSAILSRYGAELLDELMASGWTIIVRPHPQSKVSEKNMLDELMEKYKDAPNLRWDFESSNLKSMAQADVLISDFSGIIFEFAFLFRKPFLYAVGDFNNEIYDSSDIDGGTWKFSILDKMGFELKKENFKKVNAMISEISQSVEKQVEIEKALEMVWENRGKAARAVVDFLLAKQNEVSSDDGHSSEDLLGHG